MREQKTYQMERDRLKLGAWYSIEFGFHRIDFCVIKIIGEMVLLENPAWLLDSAQWMSQTELFSNYSRPIFLGYGKRRPIGSIIRRVTNLLCTLYSKPKL